MLSMLATWATTAGYLCMLLQVALILQLHRKDLTRIYPCLTALLVASTFQSLALLPLDQSSLTYGYLWVATEPFVLLIKIWMVLKIFHATANYYPSMGRFRYQALWSIVVLSAAASLTVVHFGGSVQVAALPVRAIMALESYVSWALLGILLLSGALFAFVRVPIKANLQAHRWISTAYLACSATAYLLFMHFGRPALPYTGALDMSAQCACLVLWLVYLRPAGEQVRPVVATPESRAALERQSEISTAEFEALVLSAGANRNDRTTEFEF